MIKQRMQFAIVAAFVAAVSGCASPIPIGTSAPSESVASYKRIGVVSITAQVFWRVQQKAFGVDRENIDAAAWGIDTEYEQQLARGLAAIGGFEAVQGRYPRSELYRLAYTSDGITWEAMKEPIRSYCDENRVNAVLVAMAAYSRDFASGTHQRITGAGLVSGRHGSALHLVTILTLADCRSLAPIASRGLAPLRDGTGAQVLRASPAVAAPRELTEAPLSQLTHAQRAAIKASLVEMPKDSWEPTLRAVLGR